MIDIKSLTLPELQEEMEKIGEKKFRAGQIYEWMHVKLVDSFDEMTNRRSMRPVNSCSACQMEM